MSDQERSASKPVSFRRSARRMNTGVETTVAVAAAAATMLAPSAVEIARTMDPSAVSNPNPSVIRTENSTPAQRVRDVFKKIVPGVRIAYADDGPEVAGVQTNPLESFIQNTTVTDSLFPSQEAGTNPALNLRVSPGSKYMFQTLSVPDQNQDPEGYQQAKKARTELADKIITTYRQYNPESPRLDGVDLVVYDDAEMPEGIPLGGGMGYRRMSMGKLNQQTINNRIYLFYSVPKNFESILQDIDLREKGVYGTLYGLFTRMLLTGSIDTIEPLSDNQSAAFDNIFNAIHDQLSISPKH